MSSPAFNATLELRLVPSVRAVRCVFVLHAAAISLMFLAQPPKLVGLALALLLLVSWQRLRRSAIAGYGPKALTHLIWHADSAAWAIETSSGEREEAELLGSSVVWPLLIVLNFAPRNGKRVTRALLGDEADAEAMRRLRARLLSGGSALPK